MPLPQSNVPWPPKHLAPIQSQLSEWSAWYGGDPEVLRSTYQSQRQTANFDRVSQHRGGLVGAIARFWWGRPISEAPGQRVDQLHIPLAADICQASADLLYSEPPTVSASNDETTKRLSELLDDGIHTTLASGAEVGAALGGRYHRVTWDPQLRPDGPFLTTVDADAAIPEFRWGQLVAVTFWHLLEATGNVRIRHLERHELDAQGNGIVLHGLYEGDPHNLGQLKPLEDHPTTEPLAKLVAADGALAEGRTPGLLVEYIPNQRPNRRWRNDTVGQHLGRSDLDGIEGQLDAIDEAWSSWMRDIRLGKGRIFIPGYMTTDNGPGNGSSFDLDREAYTPVKSAAGEDGDAKITLNQFAIRVEEHERTIAALVQQAVRSAGYSSQTFGENGDGAAMTATEVTARERRSYLTRDRKIKLERPALARLLEKLLSIDQALFNGKAAPEKPSVTFGDAIQESPLTLAQTTLAMDQARAASTRVKVETLHPDWTPEQVTDEVAEITRESTPPPAQDPFGFTG